MFARDNEVLISNLLGKLLLGSHSYQVPLITWAAARRGCVSDSLFSCSYPTTFHKYQDSYSSFSSASSVLEADALNKSVKCIGSNVFGHVYAISPFSSLLFRKADIWSFPSVGTVLVLLTAAVKTKHQSHGRSTSTEGRWLQRFCVHLKGHDTSEKEKISDSERGNKFYSACARQPLHRPCRSPGEEGRRKGCQPPSKHRVDL